MARIPYPISANYVHTWTAGRALVELLANTLDAAVANGTPYTTHYDYKKRQVALTNSDITISRDALMFGESTKRTRDDAIGQFGEGLKLACLVLRRERFPVRIYAPVLQDDGSVAREKWVPEIEHLEHFKKPGLVMNVTKSAKQTNDFVVEVDGVDPELWDSVCDVFLVMRKVEKIATEAGDLLLDAAEVGNLYVRGVRIKHEANFSYGFNFRNVRVDRDRKVPNEYDVKDAIRAILWQAFQTEDPAMAEVKDRELFALINSAKPEAAAFQYAQYAPVAARMAAQFRARYGADAVPVTTTEALREAELCGVKGVLVHDHLATLISRVDGIDDLATAKRKRAFDTVKTYARDDLATDERAAYDLALDVLKAVGVDTAGRVSVVDFRDEMVLGRHADKKIDVARKALSSFGEALVTLVHEFAHDTGDDGTASHVQSEEKLSAACYDELLRRWRSAGASAPPAG